MRAKAVYLEQYSSEKMALCRLRIPAFCTVCLALGMNTAWSQSRVRGIERGAVDLPAITQRASLIVRGAVTNSEVAWIDRTIYTRYDLTVTETIKGQSTPTGQNVGAGRGDATGPNGMAWSTRAWPLR